MLNKRAMLEKKSPLPLSRERRLEQDYVAIWVTESLQSAYADWMTARA